MTDTVIHLIPGYNHDPDDPKHSPYRIPEGHFHIWSTGAFRDLPVRPFPWYSGRQFRDLFRAWRAGYWDSYKWAYEELAVEAARRLACLPTGGQAFAHSLGTYVVLRALDLRPGLFSRVILCNGAAHLEDALPVIRRHGETRFLNVAVATDQVLSLAGAWFGPKFGREDTIGNGIPDLPGNVIQAILDDPDCQRRFRTQYGWELRGDNPATMGDHSYSFHWPGNWPLFRAFLAGEI